MMGISNVDFIGVASLLSGLGRSVGATGSEFNALDVMDSLERLGTASLERLADALGSTPVAVKPLVDKLVEKEFVAQVGGGESPDYALTNLGRQARKIARITQSG